MVIKRDNKKRDDKKRGILKKTKTVTNNPVNGIKTQSYYIINAYINTSSY